jgi:hypothetical protein
MRTLIAPLIAQNRALKEVRTCKGVSIPSAHGSIGCVHRANLALRIIGDFHAADFEDRRVLQ